MHSMARSLPRAASRSNFACVRLCSTVELPSKMQFPERQGSLVKRKSSIESIFDMLALKKQGSISRDEWNHAVDTIPEVKLRALARSTFDAVAENSASTDPGVITKEDLAVALGVYSSFNLSILEKSLSRNELSYTSGWEEEEAEEAGTSAGPSLLAKRLTITFEVMVSKIFPAGFGWQGASVVADGLGHGADSLPFFLITGTGDAMGVMIGHNIFYAIKKATMDKDIDMVTQVNTSILLGTAAFHAGTAWQPIVNTLHESLGCSFSQTLAGTFAGCGFMFFVGLRIGRALFGGRLKGIEPAAYSNLKADAGLSISIGGATGCFVGTDVSFVSQANGSVIDQNWLRPIVGIEEGASDIVGMATAGTSTALGFAAVQMAQNAVVPAQKCWVD